MKQITGQEGVNLTQELKIIYLAMVVILLPNNLSTIINQYLVGGDKLGKVVVLSTGVYKRFSEFDQISGKIEIVTTGLWSGDTGSLTSFFTSSVQKL